MKTIKVLSLFDGISVGRLALQDAGIKVSEYAAFEIEPHAIEISKKNWKDIEHYGDVIEADFKRFKGYDLLIGGSPCQALSNANVYLKDGEYGVNGDGKSRLFWEYVRALKTVEPKWFLFENVSSMRKTDREIITKELGIAPVEVNSILFSPQIRRRLIWTNIPFVLPEERLVNNKLTDILQDKVLDRYYLKEGTVGYILSNATGGWRSGDLSINPEFARPVVASVWKIHRADTDTYVSTDYKPEGRTNIRKLTPIECERLQTLPDNYTFVDNGKSIYQSDRYRYECIGNAWQMTSISYIFKNLKNENFK